MTRAATIYQGGVVLAMDTDDRVAEAVAVSDRRILAVGSEADILKLADEQTEHVDLDDGTLIPAFIDPHGHFPESGRIASA